MTEIEKEEYRQKQIKKEEKERRIRTKDQFGGYAGEFVHRYESTALLAVKRMFKQLNAIDVSKINIKENCINYMHDEKALENPETGSDDERDPHEDVQYYDNIKELQDQILQHTQKYQEIYDSVKTKSS